MNRARANCENCDRDVPAGMLSVRGLCVFCERELDEQKQPIEKGSTCTQTKTDENFSKR